MNEDSKTNKPLSVDQLRAMFYATDEAKTKRAWYEAEAKRNEAEREHIARLRYVHAAIREAYADCWLPWEEGCKRRCLTFRAPFPVSPQEAVDIMRDVLPNGYNGFEAGLLAQFPDTCHIYLAREGSVAVYVTGSGRLDPSADQLRCSEYSDDHGNLRLWWD